MSIWAAVLEQVEEIRNLLRIAVAFEERRRQVLDRYRCPTCGQVHMTATEIERILDSIGREPTPGATSTPGGISTQ